MSSLTGFNLRFTPNWLMTLLAILFIALFVRLGFWQIQRADEKKQMLAIEQQRTSQAPLAWSPAQRLPLQYQLVTVKGHYLPQVFLLDNQHHQHQFGYDVLSPFILENGEIVIIDRGWVLGESSRRVFPAVMTPSEGLTVAGGVYFPSKNPFVLGPGIEEKTNKVTILEYIDAKLLSHILQKKVYPFIIRLNKQDAYGFVREWAIVSMPPQRHLGYALQWFAMALVILIIFVALNLKKKNETNK